MPRGSQQSEPVDAGSGSHRPFAWQVRQTTGTRGPDRPGTATAAGSAEVAREPTDRRPRFTRRLFSHPGELVSWIVNRPSSRRVKVSNSLRFLHQVLGLERLHFGLWDGDPLTLEGLKRAQERYSELFHSWIPEGVGRILDVGAGVGTDALELARRGFQVEGLSPDPYQGEAFVLRTGLPFHLARFQEFVPTASYDLVLMGESAQYIWLESLFIKVRELAPGGYLLLADCFRIADSAREGRRGGHPLGEFTHRAEAAGFRLERRQDITEGVLPTLELGTRWLERYVEPTLKIWIDSSSLRQPRRFRFARWLLRRPIEKALASRSQIDSGEFRRIKRYLIMLWRIPD